MPEIEHDLIKELDIVNHITLVRIYDALMTLLRNINPEEAAVLLSMHEKGHFLTPPAAFSEENNE